MRGEARSQCGEGRGYPCPKLGGDGECPALLLETSSDEAPEGGLNREVSALLGCRSFLWDVLLEGDWTGCAREHLRRLTRRYGAEAVSESFER